MCIAILTTAHPDYPFILLNNRDVRIVVHNHYILQLTHTRSTYIVQQQRQHGGHLQTLKSWAATTFTVPFMAPGWV
jgi:predicted alpha/beta-fold hydrolase